MKRLIFLFGCFLSLLSQATVIPEDLTWTTQSHNSSESMPCGGGDIGINVWVENGDIYFYVNRSGSFDENSTLLKQGRFRLHLTPELDWTNFRQTLKVNDGYVQISDGKTQVQLWCDVFHPVIHVDIKGKQKVAVAASYENWRTKDRPVGKDESFQSSFKFGSKDGVITRHDDIEAADDAITFWHHNMDSTIFDATVQQQKLTSVKSQLTNPLSRLTFGGRMKAKGFRLKGQYEGTYDKTSFTGWTYQNEKPQTNIDIQITLATMQGSVDEWKNLLTKTEAESGITNPRQSARCLKDSRLWWNQFWQRSFIVADGEAAEYTRNYTLFRYMLGCNAFGEWPTKFNGGLFCFDPSYCYDWSPYTPDYRQWCGGTHTAQNQRLLYWPMLKSGDFDMMKPQLDFYKRNLHNAELRSRVYWNHGGACFDEQLDPFGLLSYGDYDYTRNRTDLQDPGVPYNAWLEYTWDTVLEFCQMAIDRENYAGMDASEYIPLVRSSLDFFDEHYRWQARKSSVNELDENGKLILYPGSGAETYKMAYNSTSTCCALQTVTKSLIGWLQKHEADTVVIGKYQRFLQTIPDISYREIDGHRVISPAVAWGRVNNTEPTQLYPVYPWRQYGVGRPDLETALNTWKYDPFVKKTEGHESWRQHFIWAACLGQTEDAVKWLRLKFANGPFRFPAFWGPGIDWAPDHNWGGSGMIGLQEMLIQEVDGKILLFPAWPKDWDIHFKLHVSQNTTVEAELRDGKIQHLIVTPQHREKDIIKY